MLDFQETMTDLRERLNMPPPVFSHRHWTEVPFEERVIMLEKWARNGQTQREIGEQHHLNQAGVSKCIASVRQNFYEDLEMLEKQVELNVKRYAESKGWLTRKWTSPGHAFVCDQIFIIPGGKVIFVEMKRPGGKCTAGQLREHEKLRTMGCDVWVIDNVDDGKRMVDSYAATHT